MPETTPKMNSLARDYRAALAARDVEFLAANSVDDESTRYTGIHSEAGSIDWSLESAIEHLRPQPPAQLRGSDPKGWYVGDVAWLIDTPRKVLPDV